ncbi:unnamed protein product [Choristocarpus tenellus]
MSNMFLPYVKGSLLYMIFFGTVGAIMPFLPLIWVSKGLSEHEVGIVGAIRPIANFLAAPSLCAIADRHNARRQMVLLAVVLWGVSCSSVVLASNFASVAAVEIASATSSCPISSLIDASILQKFGGERQIMTEPQ